VALEDSPDLPLEGWLKTLGIDSLVQWDVLTFVYRHRASLVGAEAIAHLLGYTNDPVVVALDVLESLEFVGRSRATHGVRLYQFTLPSDPTRRDCFERLNALAESRAGRLRLVKVLRPRDRPSPEGCQGAQDALAEVEPTLPIAKLRPALGPSEEGEENGGEKWLKVS
jgi:hypothetical protein